MLRELSGNNAFLTWFRTAINSARVRQVAGDDIAPHLDELTSKTCKSNDKHILALAAASGARLLYSNDRALIDDFRNRAILSNPGTGLYDRKVEISHVHPHAPVGSPRSLPVPSGS